MSFVTELRRRNVFRVGIAYVLIAWVALQGADFALDLVGAPEWVIRAAFVLAAIGLPVALAFSWAFEMTPEGLRREAEVDRSASIAPQTGRKLDRIIIGALALAVVVLLVERVFVPRTPEAWNGATSTEAVNAAADPAAAKPQARPTSTTPPVLPNGANAARDKSIAVLPLANRSVRPEDAFFAEGIHDELLTQLSRISELKVISRTSVMGYAGTTKRMPEIGAELGVATLLEGGVQRAGDRVRINVQLIEAATDEHLWAEVYDRELTADNLFDIQSSITTAIADALEAVLTGEEKASLRANPTDNVEAYGHYLRARAKAAVYGRDLEGIDEALASYQRAIELDPGFAAAFAAMSIDWSERHWTTSASTNETARALEALQRAQALAPDAVETLTAEGYYRYWGHKDYDAALAAFDRALQKKPGYALALRGRAYVLRRMGRLEDAVETFETALALDPLHAQMRVDMAFSLMHLGKVEEALQNTRQANAIGEPSDFGLGQEAELLLVLGRVDEAWAVVNRPVGKLAGTRFGAYLGAARLSRNPEWLAQCEAFLANQPFEDIDPAQSQRAHAALLWPRGPSGELDALLDSVERRIDELWQSASNAELREALLLARIDVYGLRGEAGRVHETTEEYLAIARPDAMRPVEAEETITRALARVGDFEAAFDRLETIVTLFGPWETTVFILDPLFDPVRDHPRFVALAEQNRAWLETVKP